MSEETGVLGRLAIDTALPFDGSSVWLDIDSESIVKSEPILRDNGIRGTRTRESSRSVIGPTTVNGTFTLTMTRQAFDALLYGALGTAEASNVFDVAETLPDLYILIDKRTDVVLVSEAKIGQLDVAGDQGQLVKLTVTIEAEDMTEGQTWPGTLVQPDLTKPYVFSDLGDVTIDGTARDVFGFRVTINNALSADQWANGLTRDELIVPTDREVSAMIRVGAGTENSDLMNHASSVGVGGEALEFVLTSNNESGSSVTINLGRVAFPPQQPTLSGKGPLRMELTGDSYGYLAPGETGHVPDIQITNAHS